MEKSTFKNLDTKRVAVRGKEEVYAFLTVALPSGFLSIFSPKPLCQSSASSKPLSFQHENANGRIRILRVVAMSPVFPIDIGYRQ